MRALLFFFLSLPIFAHTADDVLFYWFGKDPIANPTQNAAMWFVGGAAIDEEIQSRFGDLYLDARFGRLEEWKMTPRGRLALIILLDQFPRNLFRGSGDAFLTDALSLRIVLDGLEEQHDHQLCTIEKFFFYMPLMHAEDRDTQNLSVILLERLYAEADAPAKEQMERSLQFAKLHQEVIEEFGRFPSRNAALNRHCSPNEVAYLQQNPSF
ncbi:MAG: DUF924 domain-containing protein [Chlamydiales bacterium]|nr:DUF924 domain-containing protein [Chlamydiales bacterium]